MIDWAYSPMHSISVLRIDSRKIIFFLFIYYLCISKILYLISAYFIGHDIFQTNSILDLIRLEHIVFALTLFLILSKTININKYINFGTACTLFLFIWISFIIVFSFYEIAQVSFHEYYVHTSFIIGRGFIFILLGLNFHLIDDLFQTTKTRLVFYAVVIIYFSFILLSALFNPLSEIYPWYLVGMAESDKPNVVFGYIDISDTCALLLLFIISRAKSINSKLLIILMGAFLISLAHSRASLVSFIASGIIVYIIHFFKVNFLKKIFLSVVISLLVYISSIYVPLLIPQSKYTETHRFNIYHIANDESYISRLYWEEVGHRELKQTWFLGRCMSEVVSGRPGTYIHNWLSFWSAFGLLPFLLCVFLIIFAACKITKHFIKDANSPINEFLFSCSIFMIISIISSRAYTYHYIWFILSAIPMINHRFPNHYNHHFNIRLW